MAFVSVIGGCLFRAGSKPWWRKRRAQASQAASTPRRTGTKSTRNVQLVRPGRSAELALAQATVALEAPHRGDHPDGAIEYAATRAL